METLDRATRVHFAWLEKLHPLPEEPQEYIKPHQDVFFQDSNGKYCTFKRAVWKYYTSEYCGTKTKRDLDSISWEETLLESDLMTAKRFDEHKANGTLIFPFKKLDNGTI